MRSISLIVLLLLIGTEARAQAKKIDLSAWVGHQFGAVVDESTKDEGVDTLGPALGVPGSSVYGFILDYRIMRAMYLEVSWDRQPSELQYIDRPADTTSTVTDLSVDYYQVGLVYNWSESKNQPYIGMTFGVAHWVTSGTYDDEMGFVFTPIFGYQGWVSDYVGFRAMIKFMISTMNEGIIFTNTETGVGFDHTQDTWATQVVIGVLRSPLASEWFDPKQADDRRP